MANKRGLRRFSEGGDADEVEREDRATGITVGKDYPHGRDAAPRKKAAGESEKEAAQEASMDDPGEDTSAVSGRADRKYAKNMPSPEKKEANAERLAEVLSTIPVMRGVRAVGAVGEAARVAPRTYAERKRFMDLSKREFSEARRRAGSEEALKPSKIHKEGRFVRPGTEEGARAARVSGMKRGGAVKPSASKRADGIAMRGKTRGRIR